MDEAVLIPWRAIRRWCWLEYANTLRFQWDRDLVPNMPAHSNVERKQYFQFRVVSKEDQRRAVGMFAKEALAKEKGSVPKIKHSL